MELEDGEAAGLARTKAAHAVLLVLAMLVSVWIGGAVGFFGTPLAFLFGGVAQAFVPGASAVETAKRVGKVLAAWLLGFCACGLVFSIEY